MKSLILNEPGKWEIKETTVDWNLQEDEVLLKVHRIGICGTDMHAFRGKQPFFSYPRILGHELGLEVVGIGRQVSSVKVGDKCALEPYFNFEEDQAVKLGKTNCGEFISVFGVHQDGGMREFIKVPARYLHTSTKLTYDQLALIEPLGIGYHAVSRASIQPEDKVLVIGAGPIGLATMQFATIRQAKVVALDINEDRLQFCLQNLDLVGAVNATSDTVKEQLRELFEGDLPTVVMDATGSEHSMKNTLDYVAFGGRIVFIGLYQGDFTFFDPLFHRKEITLLASRNALGADFREIISLMEEGKVATDHWISHRVPFGDLPMRFESLLRPESGVIKAMVEL
ncbi:alcohol dehydrogenase [Algoriphagus sp. 4150]|uniref:zinc-binding alcohol dehydrogenase family protein n=1 Tax=Algoriphagus sp. 4150 TaxID=2817756 RepID=UPI00286331E1|nr:zinc-binding alcohol dehydrogenase family protein [Algoriphagus sp. 4150]MDR7131995.1 alcohol dehydrogenase [Algoriphagus sp. 4150]